MDALDPINGASVPGYPLIYVIGSYDNRITFYSQQVRGFNLAHALAAANSLKGKTRFAVIGAGAAGLSVASGLSLLHPESHVHIYEREEHPLHLQRGCRQRNLHPHIYEWPRAGALVKRANLPYLDWIAGSADQVAQTVRQQFETLQAFQHGRLQFHNLHEVTAITAVGNQAWRVSVSTLPEQTPRSYDFDAIFVAIGFGRERALENSPLWSYWSDAGVPDAPKYADAQPTVLISGSGDGGLIDLCAASLQDFDHTQLIDLVSNWPAIDELSEELLRIDREAERVGHEYDFMAAYRQTLEPRLRESGLVEDIRNRVRRRVNVVFNTERRHPLEQPTATINRLMTFLLFLGRDDANVPIRHEAGRISVAPDAGTFLISGRQIAASSIVVRHGPAKLEAFAPFEAIRAAYEANHRRWLAADPQRTQPPSLSPGAKNSIERALETQNVPVSRMQYAQAAIREPGVLRLDMEPGSRSVIQSGNTSLEALMPWWDEAERSLHLECAVRPSDLGSLACAVARFAIHARQLRLESNEAQWKTWLSDLTLKSPHADTLQLPAIGPLNSILAAYEVVDVDTAADQLHRAMDIWTLDAVDRHLKVFLKSGNEPANWITWVIEPALRSSMAQRWDDWTTRLRDSPMLLSRLLRLAACTVEDNEGDLSDRQVLVGPMRLPQIARSLAFALAAAVGWPISSPRAEEPGNFDRRGIDGLATATIHASGATLIDGRTLFAMTTQHAWSTSHVLLSELNAPVSFEAAAQRSFADPGNGIARLDEARVPGQVIIGPDDSFRSAVESGSTALVAHLTDCETRFLSQWHAQIDVSEE